jgi:hypothetical protein
MSDATQAIYYKYLTKQGLSKSDKPTTKCEEPQL